MHTGLGRLSYSWLTCRNFIVAVIGVCLGVSSGDKVCVDLW